LVPNHPPIKIAFTFLPGKNVTKLVGTFQLLDAQGQVINDDTVTWKKEEQTIDLILKRITPEHLENTDRGIQLEITNQGTKKIEAGEVKLKIMRTAGSHATIDKTVPTAVSNEY
jgi:hypothetical protein